MEKTLNERRINAVTEVIVDKSTRCDCCGEFSRHTVMRRVLRNGGNGAPIEWFYCSKCAPTAEAVLAHIDTDKCPHGIAGIDDDKTFKKGVLKKVTFAKVD